MMCTKNGSDFFLKKKPPNMKMPPCRHVQRLPERPPRMHISRTRNKSPSTKSENCCSRSCLCSKILFELVAICSNPAFFFERIADDLTLPGQGAAEFVINYWIIEDAWGGSSPHPQTTPPSNLRGLCEHLDLPKARQVEFKARIIPRTFARKSTC